MSKAIKTIEIKIKGKNIQLTNLKKIKKRFQLIDKRATNFFSIYSPSYAYSTIGIYKLYIKYYQGSIPIVNSGINHSQERRIALNMQSCEVHFIDCMGYWDLVSEIINIGLIGFIVFKTVKNCTNLIKQRENQSDIEARKSITRKFIVNFISLVYELFLASSIIFSIIIFLAYSDDLGKSREHKVNLWYKWSEIIFINVLNCLNLTVGFIYWKAVRAFFKISQKNLPIIFYSFVKLIFIFFYVFNFAIIIVSLVMLLITDDTHFEQYQIQVTNFFNAAGVSCSTMICLASRLLYQKHILNNLSLNKTAIRREQLYSFLIAFSSGCRLTCVTLNLIGIDYTEGLRNYDQNCLDSTFYNAIVMSLVTACIALIPPLIFGFIFSSGKCQKKNYAQISEYLCKNDKESVRYL